MATKRKLMCHNRDDTLNYFAYDGGDFDSSDDERDLVNVPPENDISEDEAGEASSEHTLAGVEHHPSLSLPLPIPQAIQSHLQQSSSLADYEQKFSTNSPKTESLINEAKYLQHMHENNHHHHQNISNLQTLNPQNIPYMGMQYHQLSHNCNIYHSVIGQFGGEHSKYYGQNCHSGNAHNLPVSTLCNMSPLANSQSPGPHSTLSSSPIITSPRKRLCLDADWRLERPVYTKLYNRFQEPTQPSEFKDLVGKPPLFIFEKLFTQEIFDFLRLQTLNYAINVKKDNQFSCDEHEFKAFLGFLLYNSYVTMPNERMYWTHEASVGQRLVKHAISNNNYKKIKSYIQFYDRSTGDSKERGYKVKPFISMLNKSFQQYGIYDKHLTIDKILVKLGDEDRFFLKRKPKKCGYRLWAMCGEEGYCYNFELYCGDQRSDISDTSHTGTKVVMKMMDIVKNPNEHLIFFDKFFTSRELLLMLRDKGYRASGGVRDSRLLNCTMKQSHVLANENPGAFDHRFDKNEELLACRWHGNKDVSILSNFDDIKPSCITKYYNVQNKLKTSVTQPKCIKDYVIGSRGVGLFEWYLNKHDIKIRSRRWHWCLFTKILDMIITNAWILHKSVTEKNKEIPLLEFRREIAESYLKEAAAKHEKNSVKGRKKKSNEGAQVPNSLRFDGMYHYIMKDNRGKRNRCRVSGCTKRPFTICTKCKVALCVGDCFMKYHTVK